MDKEDQTKKKPCLTWDKIPKGVVVVVNGVMVGSPEDENDD